MHYIRLSSSALPPRAARGGYLHLACGLWSPFSVHYYIVISVRGSFSVLASLLEALFCACFFASDAMPVPNSCQLPGIPPSRLAGVGLVSLSMAVPLVPFFELPSQRAFVSASCPIWVAVFYLVARFLRNHVHAFTLLR